MSAEDKDDNAELFVLDWHDLQEKITDTGFKRLLAIPSGLLFSVRMIVNFKKVKAGAWPILFSLLLTFTVLSIWSVTAILELITFFFSLLKVTILDDVKPLIDTFFLFSTLLFSFFPRILTAIDVGHNARSFVEEGEHRRNKFSERLSQALDVAEARSSTPPLILAHSAGAMATVIALAEQERSAWLVTLGSPIQALSLASHRMQYAVDKLVKRAENPDIDFHWSDYHATKDWMCGSPPIPTGAIGTDINEIIDIDSSTKAQITGKSHMAYFAQTNIWQRILDDEKLLVP